MLKTGRGLYAGASVIEIDGGEVEVVFVQSGFQARDFGTEPAGDIAVGVNGDADLALLDDGMNLDGAKSIGTEADMHLGVHLKLGGGTGRNRRRRRRRGRERRGVEHLVSLREFVGENGSGRRRSRGWRRGRRNRSRGISPSGECRRNAGQ